MHRREFFGMLLGAGGAWLVPRATRAMPPVVATHRARSIALQLGPLLPALTRDLDATLAGVRALDVTLVELSSPYAPFDRPPAAVRAALDRAGLSAEGTFIGTGPLYRGWDRALDAARTLGCTHITCAGPSPDERRAPRDWPELLALFVAAAERARAAGMRFGVRADGWMLSGSPGATPLDVMLAMPAAADVALTLDLRGAREAGIDPVAVMMRLAARVSTVHLRDTDLDAPGAAARLASAWREDGARRWVVVSGGGAGAAFERARHALGLARRMTGTS